MRSIAEVTIGFLMAAKNNSNVTFRHKKNNYSSTFVNPCFGALGLANVMSETVNVFNPLKKRPVISISSRFCLSYSR